MTPARSSSPSFSTENQRMNGSGWQNYATEIIPEVKLQDAKRSEECGSALYSTRASESKAAKVRKTVGFKIESSRFTKELEITGLVHIRTAKAFESVLDQ
jgi:hypothetical protein